MPPSLGFMLIFTAMCLFITGGIFLVGWGKRTRTNRRPGGRTKRTGQASSRA